VRVHEKEARALLAKAEKPAKDRVRD
jgi:hypothetical protein